MSPERKVKLASELISAAAKKEEALAAVLKAISKFDIQPCPPCPPGWLRPGERYELSEILPRTIKSISVFWEDGANGAFGQLIVDGVPFRTVPISDVPGSYTWTIYYPATESTRAWIEISGGCANIISVEVEYEEPPVEWIKLEPGESYPLPAEPSEISKISFDAKTTPGMTSSLGLFISNPDFPDDQRIIDEIPSSYEFTFGSTLVEIISLKNIGDAIIYIGNLTTE